MPQHGALPLSLTAPEALVLDLLAWVAARPRTYRETMDAWRTSCPRLPVWEDTLENGLVAVVRRDGEELAVRLTERGRALLGGDSATAGRLLSMT
jgi:hypothetical protein